MEQIMLELPQDAQFYSLTLIVLFLLIVVRKLLFYGKRDDYHKKESISKKRENCVYHLSDLLFTKNNTIKGRYQTFSESEGIEKINSVPDNLTIKLVIDYSDDKPEKYLNLLRTLNNRKHGYVAYVPKGVIYGSGTLFALSANAIMAYKYSYLKKFELFHKNYPVRLLADASDNAICRLCDYADKRMARELNQNFCQDLEEIYNNNVKYNNVVNKFMVNGTNHNGMLKNYNILTDIQMPVTREISEEENSIFL